jgi:hypothetical protein
MAIPISPARQRSRARPRATTTPAWRSFPGPVYRPRRPTQTPLYQVVQHHLETFLARASAADATGCGLPEWVERDFRGYLECGILAHGFARARCEACGHERLIPLPCKGRGICPSCNARRMCEVAAHLTDHVLPQVPARRRGRDPGCPGPPAQNPACGTTAPGSHLGSWRQSDRSQLGRHPFP